MSNNRFERFPFGEGLFDLLKMNELSTLFGAFNGLSACIWMLILG